MTATELAVRDDLTLSQLAGVMVKSGFFQDLKDASQAVVKILTGRELGFGPMASMQHVHVIKGKPSISAQMMAARIVASGTHMYRILRHDNEACVLAFYERQANEWVKVGESSFTMEDAKAAGLTDQDNWRKYRRNLLFARALSNGARWYCPHLTLSAPYVPEEMGVAVNEEGAPVDVITVEPVAPKPGNGNLQGEDLEPVEHPDDVADWLGNFQAVLSDKAHLEGPVTRNQAGFIASLLREAWPEVEAKDSLDILRRQACEAVLGHRLSRGTTVAEASAFIDMLNDGIGHISAGSAKVIRQLVVEEQKKAGQTELFPAGEPTKEAQ